MVTDNTFVIGDFVTVSTFETHNPVDGGKRDSLSSPTCWCTGRVLRVFFDDSVLVAGRAGYVCAFPPEDVSLTREFHPREKSLSRREYMAQLKISLGGMSRREYVAIRAANPWPSA